MYKLSEHDPGSGRKDKESRLFKTGKSTKTKGFVGSSHAK